MNQCLDAGRRCSWAGGRGAIRSNHFQVRFNTWNSSPLLKKRTVRPRLCYELCALIQQQTDMSGAMSRVQKRAVPHSLAAVWAAPCSSARPVLQAMFLSLSPLPSNPMGNVPVVPPVSPTSLLPAQPTRSHPLKRGGQEGLQGWGGSGSIFHIGWGKLIWFGETWSRDGLEGWIHRTESSRDGILSEERKEALSVEL